MSAEHVRYELKDNVAIVRLDDGKANALSHEVIGALQAALDRAEHEASAVLLVGRDKRLCAGFDLAAMTASPHGARRLVETGAELMLRLYGFPLPVVVACTGHALAAGAILLLGSDCRIGAEGDFKIGLNEVAIRLTLPVFAVELARDRLSKRHFTAATTQARIYDPVGATDAGYLDRTAAATALFDTAFEEARRLGALPQPAFRRTKARERDATIARIRETLASDLDDAFGPA